MQSEATPLKQKQQQDHQNQYYNVEFTSGKHQRRIKIDVFSAKRDEFQLKRRFFPFVNAMAHRQSQPHQANPENAQEIMHELEEVTIKCIAKQQKFNELKADNSAQHQRINKLMEELKEQKIENARKKSQLLALKKRNLKANWEFEQLKEKTKDQVEEMRMMTKRQEQSMYQCNRYIFEKEKEKQQLSEKTNQIAINHQQLSQLISEKEKILQLHLTEERELEEFYSQKNCELREVNSKLHEQILQVAVLKMQINPYMRVGFEALHNSQSSKKKILDKNPNLWQKKNKIILKEEIKYFLLIQLYPSWRRLLERLSYHFVGYKQLLLSQSHQQANALKDLDEYIFTNGMKKALSKLKHYIVTYSPRAECYHRLKETVMQLQGFSNGIIEISKIAFQKTQNQNIELANIEYNFKQEKRVKIIQMVQLKELSREALNPYIPRGAIEKTTLVKIQIPFCFDTLADRLKMEQVYKLVERER